MISVVVPVFNEDDGLEAFYTKLKSVLGHFKDEHEIIFIDDGSTDQTLFRLKELKKRDKTLRIFSFRKNKGKSEALTLAFQKARGEYIFTLDADLEENPEELQNLLKKAQEGWDIVSGWRKHRKHSFARVYSSRLANYVLSKLWGIHLHDINCGLKIYSKDAAKSLELYGGLYRFIPIMAHLKGFKVTEIVVEHENRKFGKAKFGFLKLWKDLPDAFTIIFLTKYAERPLHFFGMIGGLLFTFGFAIFCYLSFIWFQGESIGRRPLFFVCIVLMLAGLQVFLTGFLAELIINVTRKEKSFSIKYSSDTT